MFTLLYFSLGVLLLIVALPFLILLSLKKKYSQAIPARFFLYKNPPFTFDGIWFHACSLGEVNALVPLLKSLKSKNSLSVITNTGYEAAKRVGNERRFLPFEIFLPFWVKEQKALVVMEAELWYLLFWSAKKKGMKTYLINARISDRSYPRYRRFKWFYQKIFAQIDLVFAQSPKDARRLELLGAKKVVVTGNIKAYQQIVVTKELPKPKKELLVLASTHEGEEKLLLEALDFSKERVVVVVPRHPERFNAVGELLEGVACKEKRSFHRFSQKEDFESDIVLMDRMGELVNLYAISDVVLLGGSFVEGVGGHNPLEPAHFGVRIVSGKSIFNQQALYDLVENIRLCEAREVEQAIARSVGVRATMEVKMDLILKELEGVV